ncbi:hypothetical protein DE146DRAFT_614940 [Phaeosphaeria sp. MPI-PUGE-AT-0046c]|nr:hypothetical protein DE146DRAFT_614940 [Phaeosphaeria sp. MPI-PUGE-AT-0046c]
MHFLIKSAFLAYYLRLSPNRTFRLWVGVGFGLVYGSLLIGIIILVFQCIPISAALKLVDRLRAQCMNRQFVLYAPAATNIVLDIYVFILPIPTLARLQMPRRKKWGVIAVFLFGAASVLMSLIRFHSVQRLLNLQTTSDGVGEIIIVVALELNLAAIAVNLPAIRAIWVKRKNDRRAAVLSSDQYSKTGGSLGTTTTAPTIPRLARDEQIVKATRIEMTSYPNPLRDSPLSGSQEELWRNIDTPNDNVPTRHRTINGGNERFSSINLS